MIKKAVQRGRSNRRGEAYFAPYGEPLSDARTKPGEKRISARRGWAGENQELVHRPVKKAREA